MKLKILGIALGAAFLFSGGLFLSTNSAEAQISGTITCKTAAGHCMTVQTQPDPTTYYGKAIMVPNEN